MLELDHWMMVHPCANPGCNTCGGCGVVDDIFRRYKRSYLCPECIESDPIPYEELGVAG